MAKNYKRAYDALLAKCNMIATGSHDQALTIDRLQERVRVAENNLSLACNHMQAAADQLLTRDAVSTANLLRREADRLYPFKNMAATKSVDGCNRG